MKLLTTFLAAASLAAAIPATALAQAGEPYIHDPSTIAECDGKYYTFGTGGGGLVSADGWHWTHDAVRPGGGAAPDVLKIGDRYLVAYSATGGGLGGGHAGRVLTMWTRSLDPSSPLFGFSEPVEVASSLDDEDCDAIDAGLLLDPTTGRLWLSYGTYFGFIRLVELDPATGTRMPGNEPVDIAIDCEATDLVWRDGWYYLLGTHGTCCDGPNSTYNIVVGRSRDIRGPYLDNIGRDMLQGGGRMLLSAGRRKVGPGHFGRYVAAPGVEKMSLHYESDLDRGGRSVLAVLPLLWRDGWPEAGEPVAEGTYEIESQRHGYALELAVDFVRMPAGMFRFWEKDTADVVPMASQTLADVEHTWPAGDTAVRLGDYMFRPHQRWTVVPMPEHGGCLDAPYCRIVIEGTGRALTATADAEVKAAEFKGDPCQLWRIEQLTDGTYRIMPKSVPSHEEEELALVAVADSTPSLGRFDMESDNSKWRLRDR